MRAVVQRVLKASVWVAEKSVAQIGAGLLVLVGIEDADTSDDIRWLSGKMTSLRIFSDAGGGMNQSVRDVNGGLLLVSQFTLFASTKKGARPGFTRAAAPAVAIPLYQQLIAQLEADLGQAVQTGIFGADMQVELVNDGPVTILIDTKNRE